MAPQLTEEQKNKARVEQFVLWRRSPLQFILYAWGLFPQPLKPEYRDRFILGLHLSGKNWDTFCATVATHWFEDFKEGIHISWQQTLALYGVEKALLGQVPMRISIVSGHGVGKTALLSWLILWFLFVHADAQVACTSPSKEQMYDVLWKELKKWIDRMKPDGLSDQFIWETSHVRIARAPEVWFARAKTSSKENTEALAGVHGPWVLMAVDEASGVEEPIFETMEGALTSGNTLVFLISNGTRNIGYFYDSHHKDAPRWQCYSFNAEQSPRVSASSVAGWKDKYGGDSVQYAVRVLGQFPNEGIMDDRGYVQLFNENRLRWVSYDHSWKPVGRTIGSLDPNGEGQDLAAWSLRDRFVCTIPHTQKIGDAKDQAAKSITLCDKFHVDPIDFIIDAFGVGANVSQEIALATSQEKRPWRVTPVNTGDPCEDEADRELYINKRAEAYYKMMLWAHAGGAFMELPTPELTKKFKSELLSIKYKRTLSGRIQIMDKIQMKKLGLQSPNMADAASMTFLRPDGGVRSIWGDTNIPTTSNPLFNKFDPLGD